MELATQKLQKAIQSIHRAIRELNDGKKREAIGSLDFVKENCQEAIWIILDVIKNNEIN